MATPINEIGQHLLNPTLKALAKAGGTTEHADWIRSEKNADLVITFIDERRSSKFAPCSFPVPAYFELRRKFGWVSDGFRKDWAQDWRLHDSCKDAFPADSDTCELICFGERISTQDAIDRVLSRGFRLPTLHEFLLWAWKNPGHQEFSVVCLGVSFFWSNARNMPYLDWGGEGQRLQSHWIGRGWEADCRFLAIRL